MLLRLPKWLSTFGMKVWLISKKNLKFQWKKKHKILHNFLNIYWVFIKMQDFLSQKISVFFQCFYQSEINLQNYLVVDKLSTFRLLGCSLKLRTFWLHGSFSFNQQKKNKQNFFSFLREQFSLNDCIKLSTKILLNSNAKAMHPILWKIF